MSFNVRLGIAVACAVALVASGFVLERRLGPREVAAGEPATPISGAWSCPHGGGEGWKVWVSVANPGTAPVEIRMTTSSGNSATPPSPGVIEPGTVQQLEVPATLPGSGTVVEYLGGTVVAGSVAVAPDGGLAAEPCEASPGTRWHVAEASTLRGETASLVVHNPFAAQAVVDVVLTAGARQLRPGRLQGVVLGPLTARAFELNHYALGEPAVTATVTAVQGRVAVASVVTSPAGARAALALPEPATHWFLPGLGGQSDIIVRAQPDLDAPASAELHTSEGPVPAIDLEAVAAGTAEAFGIAEIEGALLVQSDGERPMIAGRRMLLAAPEPPAPPEEEEGKGRRGGRRQEQQGDRGGNRREGPRGSSNREERRKEEPEPPPAPDLASTTAANETSDRWVVPPALTPAGGASVVLVHNPGEEQVEANVAFFGPSGPTGEATSVVILPRSSVQVPVPEGAALAALVDGRGIVAAQAAIAPNAFAVVMGRPID